MSVEQAARDHAALSYIGEEAMRIRALELAHGLGMAGWNISSSDEIITVAQKFYAYMAGESTNG